MVGKIPAEVAILKEKQGKVRLTTRYITT